MDATLFFWEFSKKRDDKYVWYREYPSFKTIEAAVESYADILTSCTNCCGHRLVRTEKIGDTTIKTRIFFTLTAKQQENTDAVSI